MKAALPTARKFNILALIINLAIPLAVGAIGGFFTSSNVQTWYPTIEKPSFNPPNWIFAPVWTTLYILIGISAYLVWQKREAIKNLPRTVAIYLIQLLLNLMWSFLFFSLHLIGAALFEIIALLIAILVMQKFFTRLTEHRGCFIYPIFYG